MLAIYHLLQKFPSTRFSTISIRISFGFSIDISFAYNLKQGFGNYDVCAIEMMETPNTTNIPPRTTRTLKRSSLRRKKKLIINVKRGVEWMTGATITTCPVFRAANNEK